MTQIQALMAGGILDLQAQIKNLQAQISDRDELLEAAQREIGELRSKLSAAEEQLEQEESAQLDLEYDLREALQEVDSLRAELDHQEGS